VIINGGMMGNRLCECGCGNRVLSTTARFIPGHQTKTTRFKNALKKRKLRGVIKTKWFGVDSPFCLCGCKQKTAHPKLMFIHGHNARTKEFTDGQFKKGNVPWNTGKSLTKKEHQHMVDMRKKLTNEQAKQNRSHLTPYFDSSIEKLIREKLQERKINFQKHIHVGGILHQVDLFFEPKLIVELDGCYWHKCSKCGFGNGRNRDKTLNKQYRKKGFKVLRIWEHDINTNVDNCVDLIEKTLEESRGVTYEHTK